MKRIILTLTLFLSCACTFTKTVWYGIPNVDDHHIFDTRVVKAGSLTSPVPEQLLNSIVLDTIVVLLNGKKISFNQYLEKINAKAFLVMKDGVLVYKKYRDGYTDATISSSFSMSKSILSALVFIAVEQNALQLHDPVTKYVSELKGKALFDQVTVEHLLDMRSGMKYSRKSFLFDAFSDDALYYYGNDIRGYLAEAEFESTPGMQWAYKDADAELLAWVLEKATGMTPSQYLSEKLWQPMGASHDALFALDHKNGTEKTSHGFFATALDFARFGQVYLNGGQNWKGEKLIPKESIDASTKIDTSKLDPSRKTFTHQKLWWLLIPEPQGDFHAEGAWGQRLYINPEAGIVMVQLAETKNLQDYPFRRLTRALKEMNH